MKKALRRITALILLLAFTAVPTFAIVPPEDAAPLYPDVPDDALFIPQATAGQIALLFLDDMIAAETTVWDENTAVTDIVTLYDAQGNINAYSVEFTDGYIIVSAHIDSPNIVLEWADEAEPLYNQLNLMPLDKVVYLGGLDYYKDSGGNHLIDLQQNSVMRTIVVNRVEENRDICYVSQRESEFINSGAFSTNSIVDPFEHANTVYNGPFYSPGEDFYENQWENYIQCYNSQRFANLDGGYVGRCGPTAITSIIKSFGAKYNISIINNDTPEEVFSAVAQIGINATPLPYYVNSAEQNGGTYRNLLTLYIPESFQFYDTEVAAVGLYAAKPYTNIKSALERGSLLYLALSGSTVYQGNHSVVCYAYTRLLSNTDGSAVTYLKVADGWVNEPRYLDMESMTYNDVYMEVMY